MPATSPDWAPSCRSGRCASSVRGPYTVISTRVTPRAPKMMDCCRVWYSGASHISQRSAAKRSLLAASVLSRFGDPASSSPSNANLMLLLNAMPAARIASMAVMMATIGALSSAAPRAYSLHSGSNGAPAGGSAITRPPSSTRLSRSVGSNGGDAHSLGSSGWPS